MCPASVPPSVPSVPPHHEREETPCKTGYSWPQKQQGPKTCGACSQIAEDEIPSLEAANRLADKLEREEPGFIVKEAYRIHKDMSREELEALDFFPHGCLAEVIVFDQ